MTVAAVVALAVVALLVGRAHHPAGPEPMDAAAHRACSDFAAGYPRAHSEAARLALADKVTASSSRSDNRAIARRATEMGSSANEDDAAWEASADALTAACRDAGWASA